MINYSTTINIASTINQLKRRKWSEVAYQAFDFGGASWFWHMSEKDQQLLHAAQRQNLIFVAQKRIAMYDYRLVATTSLEWERGQRPDMNKPDPFLETLTAATEQEQKVFENV